MEGIVVHARRWFEVKLAVTDVNGNYQMSSSYNRPANYSAWFANNTFSVREHVFGLTAWINGPKQTGNWDFDINDGYDRFVGHIYRAAYRYNFKDIGGLQRPSIAFATGRRQIYVAKDESGDAQGINWAVLPIIKIWRFADDAGTEFQSDEIFSTTCHESAHTSHALRMNGGLIQYAQVSRQLQESWCIAIEWFLSNIEYTNRGVNNYGRFDYFPINPPGFPNSYGFQFWNNTLGNRNTSLYIDIVDNHNQLGINYIFRGTGTIDDQVQDYTLPFIENNLLRHIYGLASLTNELKANRPASVSDAQIDLLLSNF
jgi:hypothetical protein